MPGRTNNRRARRPAIDGSIPLLGFLDEQYTPQCLVGRSATTRRHYRDAVRHLQRFLDREPRVDDLTDDTLAALLCSMRDVGYTAKSLDNTRQNLLRLGRTAFESGLLPAKPFIPNPTARSERLEPWSAAEVERIILSARTMPGDVADIPARLWWPALVLLMLDTGCTVREALGLPAAAYNRERGTIAVGLYVLRLHRLTAFAISDRLVFATADHRLLPWTLDVNRSQPLLELCCRYKELLSRADLPYDGNNLFDRLRSTRRTTEPADVLDRINLDARFTPRPGRPDVPAPDPKESAAAKRSTAKRSAADRPAGPAVWRIGNNSDRTLKRFFEDAYRPRRLNRAASNTIGCYRRSILRLGDYAACDVTLDQFSDWLLEGFLIWLDDSGRFSPHTINNSYRSPLLALWNFAYKRKLIDERPGDVPKLHTPKRQPQSWSQEELASLLRAAAETTGLMSGIPAGRWWSALLMTLYDTGLRISALLAAECRQLDLSTGWLMIPAEVQKQNADQSFLLHPDTLRAIARTRPETRDCLFPHPWTTHHPLTSRFKEILSRAGLPHGRKDVFHKLRRTHATYLAAATDLKHVQASLGHSSPAVTLAYIDPTKAPHVVRATDILPRPAVKQEGVA